MELWKMRYFIQVCHDQSITKAASNLFISQQGLSKTIKNIEDEFQAPLLERSSRGVNPTKYGEILLDKCKMIISEYDDMVKYMNQEIQYDNNSICIGISSILHTDFLKSILYSFQEKNHDVTLKFIELGSYACEEYLKKDWVDFCITLKPTNIRDFKYIPICETGLVLLINKKNPLNEKRNINIKDLKNQNFIMLTEDYKLREITNDFCIQAGFKPKAVFTTSQLDFIKELVELNAGIAILPDSNYLKHKNNNSNVIITNIRDITYHIEIGINIKKSKKKLINKLIKSLGILN